MNFQKNKKFKINLIKSNEDFFIDKEKIKLTFKQIKYPIYFLDFETISRAIPIYENSSPYQQIPFQFSLHIKTEKNLEHKSFIMKDFEDPRKFFLKSILEYIKNDFGSVVVYFEGFESKILRDLSEFFPQDKKKIDEILNRFFDIHKIFANFNYYNKKQMGSTSIKKVLPILCPKFSYDNLEIKDGGSATTEFYNLLTKNLCEFEKEKKIENLLKYCELDTLAMVKIFEELEKLCL